MNKQDMDILNVLHSEKYKNQRDLAENSGHSLGVVNRSLKDLINNGYIDSEFKLTDKAKAAFWEAKPKNAVILAAGFGMRMVPINMEVPKGLLEVNGEPLIERTIKQLHEAGIREIYVVVGFMKEQYEYLIDEYGVELIAGIGEITTQADKVEYLYKTAKFSAGIYYFTQKETIYYQSVERVYNYSFEEFEKKCKELTQKILGHDENWKDSFDESLKIIRNLHYGSCYAVESRCIILAMNVCHDLLECKVIDEENRKKLEREVEALRGQNTYEDLKKKFKSIMERFVNECVFYKGNQENDSIFKVKEYISEHFSEDITLEKMAQMVYMNPYYFSAFFKKETGENFKAYLLEVRMKKALQYLMETNMKTYELASQVGYKDVRTFTDKFRDFYGCSPAKYKKNNR